MSSKQNNPMPFVPIPRSINDKRPGISTHLVRIDSEWSYLPATVARGSYVDHLLPHIIYRDRFWLVTGDGDLLFYDQEHPACNADERVVRDKLELCKHAVQVEFVKVAYVPIHIGWRY